MGNNTVVFLGAGASAQDGAPVQKQLMNEFQTFYKKLPPKVRERGTYKRLSNFFRKFFGIELINHDEVCFPTFEEMLGIIDIAIERNESFSGNKKYVPLYKLHQQRQDLIFLIL